MYVMVIKFVVSGGKPNFVICGQFEIDFSPFHNKLKCNVDINM